MILNILIIITTIFNYKKTPGKLIKYSYDHQMHTITNKTRDANTFACTQHRATPAHILHTAPTQSTQHTGCTI